MLPALRAFATIAAYSLLAASAAGELSAQRKPIRVRIPGNVQWTWIDPVTMAAIDADFEPADLAPVARAAGVTATVVVQSIASEADHLAANLRTMPTARSFDLARMQHCQLSGADSRKCLLGIVRLEGPSGPPLSEEDAPGPSKSSGS